MVLADTPAAREYERLGRLCNWDGHDLGWEVCVLGKIVAALEAMPPNAAIFDQGSCKSSGVRTFQTVESVLKHVRNRLAFTRTRYTLRMASEEGRRTAPNWVFSAGQFPLLALVQKQSQRVELTAGG